MKMKKTQSLKLMLLGLMALVSTGAWAQHVMKQGVIYAVKDGKATVVGVTSAVGTNIYIEDVDGDTPTVDFAEGWMNPENKAFVNDPTGDFKIDIVKADTNVPQSAYTVTGSGTQTIVQYNAIDATALENVKIVLRATGLNKISKADFEGLNISIFTLGSTSAVTVIPDYLFANATANYGSHQNDVDNLKERIAQKEEQIKTKENNIANLQKQIELKEESKAGPNNDLNYWTTKCNDLDVKLAKFNGVIAASQPFDPAMKTYWKGTPTAEGDASWNSDQKATWAAYIVAWNALKNEGEVGDADKFDYTTKWETLKGEKNQAASKKDEAQDQLDQIDSDIADLQSAIDLYQGEIDELNNNIADLQEQIDAYTEYDVQPNPTLTAVHLYNGILEKIGKFAFADCVNATIDFGKNINTDLFPATIEEVGASAFKNTLMVNANFSQAASEDLKIAGDAFKGTPLVTLMLKGVTSTAVTPAVVHDIAQSLKTEDLSLEFCDPAAPVDATVNNTLTTVTLPDYEGYNVIAQKTFWQNWALTSVAIPAGITKIQAGAFAYTNVEEFDLHELVDLDYVGQGAFAWNPSLKTVIFAPEATVTELKGNTFKGSCKLATVKFNDDMETLEEGLFATNALTALELCNTNVKVLNDLFEAGPGQIAPNAAPGTELRMPNTTVKYVCLPEGLEEIKKFALSSLQALVGTTNDPDALAEDASLDKKVVIPNTVDKFGDAVFYNDIALEEVEFMDTPLQGLKAHTFGQCSSLKKVTFISINGVNPTLFNQPENEPITWNTYWGPTFGLDLTQQTPSTMIDGIGDNMFFSCYNKKTEVVVLPDAFTELVGAHVYKEGGIGAYSYLTKYEPTINLKVTATYNGTEYKWGTYASKYATWIKAVDGLVVYSAYQDGHKIVLYPAKIKDGYYKIAAYDPNVEWYMPYYKDNGQTGAPSLAYKKGNDAAAACIIRYTDNTVKPELYTNSVYKYQTTLDVENILEILDEDVQGNSNTNYYRFGALNNELAFNHITDPLRTIVEGSVVINTGVDQGYGSRLNVIVVDEKDATAVKGIKEYRQSLSNSDAIYNLNGARVSTPVKGQIYIQNGKKFIVK